jgi:hypothetical protein
MAVIGTLNRAGFTRVALLTELPDVARAPIEANALAQLPGTSASE